MRLALDTNRYVDLCRGVPQTAALVDQADEVILPVIVLGELRSGFAGGSREVENERLLRAFLSKPRVSVAHTDDQTTRYYAAVFRQLRKQGTPIPTNDMWIAALVLQHDAALHARDQHFDHLPQIRRV